MGSAASQSVLGGRDRSPDAAHQNHHHHHVDAHANPLLAGVHRGPTLSSSDAMIGSDGMVKVNSFHFSQHPPTKGGLSMQTFSSEAAYSGRQLAVAPPHVHAFGAVVPVPLNIRNESSPSPNEWGTDESRSPSPELGSLLVASPSGSGVMTPQSHQLDFRAPTPGLYARSLVHETHLTTENHSSRVNNHYFWGYDNPFLVVHGGVRAPGDEWSYMGQQRITPLVSQVCPQSEAAATAVAAPLPAVPPLLTLKSTTATPIVNSSSPVVHHPVQIMSHFPSDSPSPGVREFGHHILLLTSCPLMPCASCKAALNWDVGFMRCNECPDLNFCDTCYPQAHDAHDASHGFARWSRALILPFTCNRDVEKRGKPKTKQLPKPLVPGGSVKESDVPLHPMKSVIARSPAIVRCASYIKLERLQDATGLRVTEIPFNRGHHRGYCGPLCPYGKRNGNRFHTAWLGERGSGWGCPSGWTRLAIGTDAGLAAVERWPVAYHGCSTQAVHGILKEGFRTSLGIHGRQCVYFSPSIRYSACPRYARVYVAEEDGVTVYYQVALETRLDPARVRAEWFDETMCAANKVIDPCVSNSFLETAVQPSVPGANVTQTDGVVVTGLMVRRLENCDPADLAESAWWGQYERVVNASLHQLFYKKVSKDGVESSVE